MSAPSIGLTSSHLFTRSRDPTTAFARFDPSSKGTVSLDDARAAFRELGVKLTLTEARSLARAQVNGDRGVPHTSLSFDYGAFLRGAGAATPRAPTEVEPPPAAGEALATMTARLLKDRGAGGEGYGIMLNQASPRAFREYPLKPQVRRARLPPPPPARYQL